MTRRFPTSVLACVLTVVALGCRGAPPPAQSAATSPARASSTASPGSGAPPTAAAPAQAARDQAKDQGHEHTAPHGGTLVELGEESAHVELVLDRASGTLTAFVLDGEAERPIRISQPTLRLRLIAPQARTIELTGRTNALTGERSGATSEFTLMDEALRTSSTVTGEIVELTVRGMRFTEVDFALQP